MDELDVMSQTDLAELVRKFERILGPRGVKGWVVERLTAGVARKTACRISTLEQRQHALSVATSVYWLEKSHMSTETCEREQSMASDL